MKNILKLLAIVFTGYFVWAAYMNSNDLDATLWYFIYGIAAIASLLFIAEKLPKIVYLVLAVGYVGVAFYFWPETYEGVTIGEGDIKNIEEGREALGLLINAVVMALYGFASKSK